MPLVFETESALGKKIRLGRRYWEYLTSIKHAILSGKEKLVERAVHDADFVRRSRKDGSVYLYYLAYNEYWLCAVCKHENGKGFVVTVYVTDRVKEGEEVWKR